MVTIRYDKQFGITYTAAGKNIAVGKRHQRVMNGWMNSPGHRAIYNSSFTEIGVGYVTDSREPHTGYSILLDRN